MHGMQLSPEQVRAAVEHFTAGKSASYPLMARLAALKSRVAGRRDLLRAFVEIQMQAAIGAGDIGGEKRRLLWRVANDLGIGRVELAQIEALARLQHYRATARSDRSTDLAAAYRVLGVETEASNDQVKTAYRRLMNQHHPDKLVSRGLPESMAGIAEQKTLEIRAAYERIKDSRGFK
jgi:DnaJ like chaperone protein